MNTMVLAAEESFGSLMKQAGFNTVLGIGTVFIMLIIISLIIYCFRFIPMIQKRFGGKREIAQLPAQPVARTDAGAEISEEDDLELIAVISAAIAASAQVPADSFVVRTIKRRA